MTTPRVLQIFTYLRLDGVRPPPMPLEQPHWLPYLSQQPLYKSGGALLRSAPVGERMV